MANWFIYAGLTLSMLVYIILTKQAHKIIQAIQTQPRAIFSLATADIIAWVAFVYSATLIPIGLAVSISEAYIALEVLLGLYLNKEKLQPHQLIGIGIIILAVITLSYIS